MNRHRTTARGVLLAAVLGLAAGTAGAATPSAKAPPRIVFPVVGPATYSDDFGAPRGQGRHEGIDILAPKKAPAVATESGKIKFWTTSARAGCMLYLYGQSGTTYLYIHLNNDLGKGNDNRGKCVAGTAYARGLKNGAAVGAGQLVGYVGDSGDANGGPSHLHFEVHPGGGSATNPYPYLQAAQRLLFSAKPGTPFALTLTGSVIKGAGDKLQLNVSVLEVWPTKQRVTNVRRALTLKVPPTALVQGGVASASTAGRLSSAYRGQPVVVWTQPAPATLKAQRGDPGALNAALVQLG